MSSLNFIFLNFAFFKNIKTKQIYSWQHFAFCSVLYFLKEKQSNIASKWVMCHFLVFSYFINQKHDLRIMSSKLNDFIETIWSRIISDTSDTYSDGPTHTHIERGKKQAERIESKLCDGCFEAYSKLFRIIRLGYHMQKNFILEATYVNLIAYLTVFSFYILRRTHLYQSWILKICQMNCYFSFFNFYLSSIYNVPSTI